MLTSDIMVCLTDQLSIFMSHDMDSPTQHLATNNHTYLRESMQKTNLNVDYFRVRVVKSVLSGRPKPN